MSLELCLDYLPLTNLASWWNLRTRLCKQGFVYTRRYEVKVKKKTACISEIAADIAARFLSRQGRVQSGERRHYSVLSFKPNHQSPAW